MNKRSLYSSVTALAAGLLLAVAAPLAASAHVSVGPNQAAAGSFTLISFKVPTESATAVTNKIVVTIPKDTPFAYVSYVPVPGWTTELTTEKLATPIKGEDGDITDAVTSVTWTASPGSEIKDGQLQLFPLSVGPVPDTGSIVLAAQQTYSDGTVVDWNGTAEGAEHPAPVLYVNDTPPSDHHSDGATVEAAHDEGAAPAATDDVLARVLGIGGLVVGIVGVVIGITGRRKSAA